MQKQPNRVQHYCSLHLGMTAGTALRAVTARHNETRPDAGVDVFTHDTALPDICDVPPGRNSLFSAAGSWVVEWPQSGT